MWVQKWLHNCAQGIVNVKPEEEIKLDPGGHQS